MIWNRDGKSVGQGGGRGDEMVVSVLETLRHEENASVYFSSIFPSVAVALTTIRRRATPPWFSSCIVKLPHLPQSTSFSSFLFFPLTHTLTVETYYPFTTPCVYACSRSFDLSFFSYRVTHLILPAMTYIYCFCCTDERTNEANGLRPDARIEPWSIV